MQIKLKRIPILKFGLAILVGVGVVRIATPVKTANLVPNPNPAKTYDEAFAKLNQLHAYENEKVNPVCRSTILGHDEKVANAVVLLHGLSNCPRQFAELGKLFHEHGYNVLIPRMPQNGYPDRYSVEFRRLRAENLREYADISLDIACGLGENITVMGLSGGGVVACWLAQYRPEAKKVVIIAPALGLGGLPTPLHQPLLKMLLLLPNVTLKRDPATVLPHAYLQQTTRGTAQMMRLGEAVFKSARKNKPVAKSIILVLNPLDRAVSNPLSRALFRLWKLNGAKAHLYKFDKAHDLKHDLISAQQPFQKTHVVYPILFKLATEKPVR
jgi:esterase/lipase